MTEQEFMECKVGPLMVDFLCHGAGTLATLKWVFLGWQWSHRASPRLRKLRLVTCACCRRTWHLLADERSRQAVETAEAFADREVGQKNRSSAAAPAWLAYRERISNNAAWAAAACLDGCADPYEIAWDTVVACHSYPLARPTGYVKTEHWRRSLLATEDAGMRREFAAQANLLRDIFGNPFRPCGPLSPAVLAWNDGTVRRIVRGIYNDKAFDCLPILADALLDAGCDNDELIQHCRSEGPHVRGCWALDLVLGRQ